MKLVTLLIAMLLFKLDTGLSQRGPLEGNGKIIHKSYEYSPFDKVYLEDLDGNIIIEVGKKFSVEVDIDQNLFELLDLEKDDKQNILFVRIKDNENNKRYLENTNIVVRITMPEVSIIKHRGNSQLKVVGVLGRYFRIENDGNGDVEISGSVINFEIEKKGNGNIDAKKLIAKIVKVKGFGSGDVSAFGQISFSAHGSGNNDIIQFGPGQIQPFSFITGNGKVKSQY